MLKTKRSQDKMNLVVVTGPTASGKTGFAAHLANSINGEIISADSRQVYKGMDLGTGKDYDDYNVKGHPIPFHLIDIMDPGSPYNVYSFQQDFLRAYSKILNNNNMPILCGGTGLYIEAVLKGYKLIEVPPNEELRHSLANKTDDELINLLRSMQSLHNKSDTENRKRLVRAIEIASYYQNHPKENHDYPSINSKNIGIRFDRAIERERITKRLKERIESGMVQEVEALVKMYGAEKMEYFGLEYKFITWHIMGKITYDEMFSKLNTAIHQFAKRQMTWFRRMEKNGFEIRWIDGALSMDQKLEIAKNYIQS